MNNDKFVKAYCSKKDQYFGLIVGKKNEREDWKVVNFLPIERAEGKVVVSQVKQNAFYTADNLQACPVCGNRKIGGCSCATRRGCPGPDVSCISCAYCGNLQVDYSKASASAGGYRKGDVVTLGQGQEIKLDFDDETLKHIEVRCGWDPARSGDQMDVDSSVIVMGSTGCDTVYFGDLRHPSGCVVHHGDDLTGGRGEEIDVYFDKVPVNRTSIAFVINIYRCLDRHQTLGDVRNMYIQLRDPVTHSTLVEYREMGNMRRNTALIIGVATKKDGAWYFKAVGQPSNAPSIGDLASECYRLFR